MVPSQFSPLRAVRGNVLLMFPGALGDFLCMLPSLLAVRAETSGRVAVAARSDWLALLTGEAFERYSIESRAIAELFGAGEFIAAARLLDGFDEVHSWTGHGDRGFMTRLRALSPGPRVEVHPFRAFAQGEHAADYYARCLGVSAGPLCLAPADTELAWARGWHARVDPGGRPLLVVHAGSGAAAKNWMGFASVVGWWRQRGGVVAELIGPAETERGGRTGADACVREALPRVAAVLGLAAAYAGNDSGITHLAAAVGTPGVALFGCSRPDHWAPRGASITVLLGGGLCAPCGPGVFCTHGLPPELVTASLEARLEPPVSAAR